MFDLLSRDDYQLTLDELKGQRVQVLLQLSALDASIRQFEAIVKEMSGKTLSDVQEDLPDGT